MGDRAIIDGPITDTYHLLDDAAPLGRCDSCQRLMWGTDGLGGICNFPQPYGGRCTGTLVISPAGELMLALKTAEAHREALEEVVSYYEDCLQSLKLTSHGTEYGDWARKVLEGAPSPTEGID